MGKLSEKLQEEELSRAEKVSMPDWLDPMLAKLTHDPFSDDNWVYERKLDGERALAYIESDGTV
ncbi:MAG: ATP-dependent DNA ligase, partial [Candidatus Aegiribacteria sp.]